jgi:uncharacterized protein YndB with AHSA1/START domain
MSNDGQVANPHGTTTVSRNVQAPPQRIWAELADAWMYPVWLVGATHIRDVDATWPSPGAKLHHSVGPWPFSVSDTTEVVEAEQPHKLTLRARMWPIGEMRVDLVIEPDGENSRVTMTEGPLRGPSMWVHNPIQKWMLKRRNIESLNRLATVAEKRPSPTQAGSDHPAG